MIATLQPVRRTKNGSYQRTNTKWVAHRRVNDGTLVGDIIQTRVIEPEDTSVYHEGFRHGLIYGDGTQDRMYANGDYRYRIRLCGKKVKYSNYFEHVTYPPFAKGDACIWMRSANPHLKKLPDWGYSTNYLAGFVDGWMATDGCKKGSYSYVISSTNPLAEYWLIQNAELAGWQLRSVKEANIGKTSYAKKGTRLWNFNLCRPNDVLAWRVLKLFIER